MPKVKAETFHPMSGHVTDGMQVDLKIGTVTLHNLMSGWGWKDANGGDLAPIAKSAFEVTEQLLELASMRTNPDTIRPKR